MESATATQSQRQDGVVVYIGTYTSFGSRATGSKGIYVYRLDLHTGQLRFETATHTENPSYLALDPARRHLYAVNELMNLGGQPDGGVSAFAIDPATAGLTPLNQQSSQGGLACYVSIEQTGRYALVANYAGGNVIMLPIQADGRLDPASDVVQHHGASVDPQRQKGPYAHSIITDPANRYAFAADLGIDKIVIYQMDLEKGKLLPHGEVKVHPGAGPRHLTFHPNGRFAYLIQEINSTLTAFAYHADKGSFEELQTVPTLPQDFRGQNTAADVHVSPDGKFVYGSNRGHDSIVIHAIDAQRGTLTYVGHVATGGKTPRNFAIDPSGTYLLAANQDTNNVVTFRMDQASGQLQETGLVTEIPMPVCVKMVRF